MKLFKTDTIVELFANQFEEEVSNIVHKCDEKIFQPDYITQTSNSIFLENVEEGEVISIMRSLQSDKGSGSDGIRPKDLKNNATAMAPMVTRLINLWFENGKMPEPLKNSIIRPIYKSGCKSDSCNYRPISILPAIEKIMEEVLLRRLTSYLQKYNVIDKRQYGFQKGRTINQLLGNFSDHLNTELGKGMHSLVLFIDFSKAFDTIPHKGLLDSLHDAGIRGKCLNLIADYLDNRSFNVRVGNSKSKIRKVKYGVPQGSKLGPILFLIHTNKLLTQLNNKIVFSYADDTALVVSNKCLLTARNQMQNTLDQISKWCHDNGLIINAKKTKLMHVRPSYISPNQDTVIINYRHFCSKLSSTGDTPIELVSEYKYLGVTVDEHLKWHKHIDNIQKKLRSVSFVLQKLCYCSNKNIIKLVYQSLAESILRYGITAWGSSTHCTRLQRSQNRLLKIVKSVGVKEVFFDIKTIYKVTLINEFYNESRYRKNIDHSHNTRRKTEGKFKTAAFRNMYEFNTLNCQIPRILNELPSSLLNIKMVNRRKKLLKDFYRTQQQPH